MKSTVDKLEGLQRKLTVEYPKEKVADAFNKVYQNIRKNASIKGFRKGKAPLNQIKAMYADKVTNDVLQNLVSEGYQQALRENNVIPVTDPQLNFDQLKEDQAFSFTAEFEIRPEVDVKEYENLEVQKEKLELEPDAVDKALENIRNSRTSHEPVLIDRPADETDVAEIDFEGFVDGKPLENGSAKNHKLELGAKTFIDGFEDNVIGMMPGQEKRFDLKFPEDYHAEQLAGKPVEFRVTLNKLYKKAVPLSMRRSTTFFSLI